MASRGARDNKESNACALMTDNGSPNRLPIDRRRMTKALESFFSRDGGVSYVSPFPDFRGGNTWMFTCGTSNSNYDPPPVSWLPPGGRPSWKRGVWA